MCALDRRSFLKAGAFGTAGLAIAPKQHLRDAKPWNAASARALRKFRDPAPTVCRMCPSHCAVLAFRDGDRVVQVHGAVGAPTNRGAICARALAGMERLYDPERQLTPLRRAGKRGAGNWEAISWAEALATLGAHLNAPEARRVLHLGQEELLVEELRDNLGWTDVVIDHPLPGREGPGSGAAWYGAPLAVPNANRARSIFLFGVLPFDGRFPVPLAKDVSEAQRNGAAVHLFHSLEGASGSVTRWHPVAPDSEAFVAYGVARLILRWDNFDRDGFSLRTGGSGETGELERVREAVAPYTPERVEELTGVPASQVVYLSRRFAEETPSLALATPGSTAAPAAALLNQLVGSVNVAGGAITSRGPFFTRPPRTTATPEALLAGLCGGETRAELYWAVNANPVYDAPDTPRVRETLADPDRVGFLVAMDTHLTETADLADLFLPLATHFESWGLVEGSLPDGRSYLYLQQPVTRPASEPDKLKAPDSEHLALFEPWARPLGESRGLSDVLLELARGRGAALGHYADTRHYLGELLRKSWGPGSLEALQERGVWVSEEGRPPNRLQPVELASTVPSDPQPAAADALFLLLFAPASLAQANPNSRWGREIRHRASVHLHPGTARRLGLSNGDRVRVASTQGALVLPLLTLEGLHPAAVAVPDGFGHSGWGSVARGEAAPPAPAGTAPGQPIWWAGHGAGPSARALFPFRSTGDGLQDWSPLPVTVTAV
ncbi:MAG TPA: molybdopterin dinucleotide binding domain-containing protein [Deferrisomatales bacterium]|nr:molybdopterin dinucleotide binding domain-containing protein [Deferrisomatales bacterium]